MHLISEPDRDETLWKIVFCSCWIPLTTQFPLNLNSYNSVNKLLAIIFTMGSTPEMSSHAFFSIYCVFIRSNSKFDGHDALQSD